MRASKSSSPHPLEVGILPPGKRAHGRVAGTGGGPVRGPGAAPLEFLGPHQVVRVLGAMGEEQAVQVVVLVMV